MRRDELERTLDGLLGQPAAAPAIAPPTGPCICGGSGNVFTQDSQGNRFVRECSCRAEARIAAKLSRAQLPERYRTTTLDSYDALDKHPSLARGLAVARRWAAEYPIGTAGRGVLLVGPVGVGKTHLAVGMLRQVVLERGAKGVFADFRELLQKIKRTFGDKTLSEAAIVDPLFEADVVVLDELGAVQHTEWTFDAVERIINGRYNDNKSTIITTNLPNAGPGAPPPADFAAEYGSAARSARGETLGDRIGARMHSRLQQMCAVVEMTGEDYRSRKGKR